VLLAPPFSVRLFAALSLTLTLIVANAATSAPLVYIVGVIASFLLLLLSILSCAEARLSS
jgi:hypothetical protein